MRDPAHAPFSECHWLRGLTKEWTLGYRQDLRDRSNQPWYTLYPCSVMRPLVLGVFVYRISLFKRRRCAFRKD